jgi:hypothetical protein
LRRHPFLYNVALGKVGRKRKDIPLQIERLY